MSWFRKLSRSADGTSVRIPADVATRWARADATFVRIEWQAGGRLLLIPYTGRPAEARVDTPDLEAPRGHAHAEP